MKAIKEAEYNSFLSKYLFKLYEKMVKKEILFDEQKKIKGKK